MTGPLVVDPDQIIGAAGQWDENLSGFDAPAPNVAGSSPTHAAAEYAIGTAGADTDLLKQNLSQTADDARNSADAYEQQEKENTKALDFKGDKNDVDALLKKVRVVPSLHAIPGYDRRCGTGHACDFGEAWHDPTHPGVNTRQEILKRDLTDVTLAPGTHGKVTSGWEIDPYTGQRTDLKDIQIDHIFPLQRAWDMGAADWVPQQRVAFANDPDNLLAVSGQANQDKGWMGPGEWLPPDASERLDYAERYLRVAVKYDLPITQAEYQTILAVPN